MLPTSGGSGSRQPVRMKYKVNKPHIVLIFPIQIRSDKFQLIQQYKIFVQIFLYLNPNHKRSSVCGVKNLLRCGGPMKSHCDVRGHDSIGFSQAGERGGNGAVIILILIDSLEIRVMLLMASRGLCATVPMI